MSERQSTPATREGLRASVISHPSKGRHQFLAENTGASMAPGSWDPDSDEQPGLRAPTKKRDFDPDRE